jgi:hypothetical protein
MELEHGHEGQRNGVIGLYLVISGFVLLVFFIAGNAYFETTRVNMDYKLRLSAPYVQRDELRMRENIVLDGYAWVDKEKGQVQIPVTRAMELVLADYGKAASGQ